MPEAAFGQDIKTPGNNTSYFKLKNTGDRLKFVIAKTPHYENVHWIDRQKVVCPKFSSENQDVDCSYCDKYQTLIDSNLQDEARDIAPQSIFYYPVVDVENNKALIFQFTAKSIHWTINAYAKKGVDVFSCVWEVERKEANRKVSYEVLNLGPVKVTRELDKLVDKAKELKVSTETKSSSSVVAPEDAQMLEE